jgi:O-antigen/teichoic acid export membrane protein
MVVTLHKGIVGVFVSKLIALTLLTTTTFIINRKQFNATISLNVFQKLVKFTLPGYPGMIIKQLMDILPRYILAAFAPLTAVGLYGVSFRISQILRLYVNSFNRAWSPFAFSQADKPEEQKLYEVIFKAYALSMLFIGLGLSLFSKEVIMLLTPKQYYSAYYMVGGVAFYLGMRGLTLMFGTSLYIANQVKWTSYIDILQLVIFLAAAFYLVPRYHTAGLIAALDISVTIYFVCYMQVSLKYFKFRIPKIRLMILLILSSFSVYVFNNLNQDFLMSLFFKFLFLLMFIPVGTLFVLSSKEKAKVQQLLIKAI